MESLVSVMPHSAMEDEEIEVEAVQVMKKSLKLRTVSNKSLVNGWKSALNQPRLISLSLL